MSKNQGEKPKGNFTPLPPFRTGHGRFEMPSLSEMQCSDTESEPKELTWQDIYRNKVRRIEKGEEDEITNNAKGTSLNPEESSSDWESQEVQAQPKNCQNPKNEYMNKHNVDYYQDKFPKNEQKKPNEILDFKEILKRLEIMEYKMLRSFTSIVKRLEDIEDCQMNVFKFAEETYNLILKDKKRVRDASTQCFIKKKPPVTIIPSNSHEKYKKKTKTPKKQLKEPKNLASWSSSVKKPPYNKSYNNKDSNYHFNEEITSSNTEVSHNEYSYLKKCGRSRNSNVRVRHNTRNDAENSEQFQEDEDKTDEDDVDEDDYSFSHVD